MVMKWSGCFGTIGSRIVVPHHADFNVTDQFTIEFKAWLTGYAPGTFPTAICKGVINTAWNMQYSKADNTMIGRLRIGAVSYDVSAIMPGYQWVHVAMTYNGSVQKLCLNGIEVASSAVSGNINSNAGDLYFGDSEEQGRNTWGGLITDMRLWNIYRPPATILDEKDERLVGDEPGLIGYWKLDDWPSLVAVSQVDSPTKDGAAYSSACWSQSQGNTY